jgi:Na+-transporting methylmalonyl-CoA/oxaloacetate decarboxylase gamma subunit
VGFVEVVVVGMCVECVVCTLVTAVMRVMREVVNKLHNKNNTKVKMRTEAVTRPL